MAIAGSRPILCAAAGVLYLGYYTSGVQNIVRSQSNFSSLLTFTGGATTGVVTTATADARMGMCKMQSAGRPLVAVVPYGSGLVTYVSKNDGLTWSQVA